MLDDFKQAIEKSRDRLEDLLEKIEDSFDDASEETVELWHQLKPRLASLKKSLLTATHTFHTQSDEARLQAHLATLDAHDQWNHLSDSVTQLAKQVKHKTEPKLQQAALQAHLAKMDARDFMASQGPKIKHDFKEAGEKVEQASKDAAYEMGRSFEKAGAFWS